MIRDIQDEIMRLKKENDVCILAHLYQNDAILEVADYTGDSFALAKLAQTVPNKTVLMCGVRFMAETVKMLAPDKRVLLSNPDAGCPMAEQMDREVIEQVKENYPDYTVVAYINTTAELKTVCDVCVTSSSAEKVIRKIDNDFVRTSRQRTVITALQRLCLLSQVRRQTVSSIGITLFLCANTGAWQYPEKGGHVLFFAAFYPVICRES